MRTQHKKIIMGLFVLILCIVLGYSTVSNYLIQYNTISEILDDNTYDKEIHVEGTIKPGSFTHLYNNSYSFVLTDDTASMNVIYTGSLPSSFSENSEIVVIGSMINNTFETKILIASCPSKFTE